MIDKTDGNVAKEVNRRKITTNLTKKQMKTVNEKNNISKNPNKNESSINELSDWIQLSDSQLKNSKKTYGKRVNNLSEQQKTSQIISNPMNSKPIQPMVSSTVLSTIRPQTIEDYKPFKCEFCDKRFGTYGGKHKHLKTADLGKTYKCYFEGCHRSFVTQYCLLNHQLIHKNETPFKCEVIGCNYSAKYKSFLNSHQELNHSKEKSLFCKINGCVARFQTKRLLDIHVKYNHTNARLKCHFEGCGKQFGSNVGLRIHSMSHSEKNISCNWSGCQYTTNRAQNLKIHKRIHSNVPNFLCDWPECGKAFKVRTELKLHHRLHTNEKPYSCEWPGCEYRGATCSNLSTHKRVHNKI